MLFNPSLKLKAIISTAQLFLLLSLLVQLNLAGVIKKRDLAEIESSLSFTQNEQQISPTPLSAKANESESNSTILKLQPAISNFATESSKELSYNEIVLNEAKKLIDVELKSSTQNHTSISSRDEDEQKAELEDKLKDSQLNEEYAKLNQNFSSNASKLEGENNKLVALIDPLVHEKIEKNLENISQQLSEKLKVLNPIITTTQFSSNVIQEEEEELEKITEKVPDKSKLTDRFKQLESAKTEKDEDNNLNSFENSIKSLEEKPRPPSQILKELKTESETEASSLNFDNRKEIDFNKAQTISHNENSIETKQNAETKSDQTISDHMENTKPVKDFEIPVTKNTTTIVNNPNKTSSFVPTLLTEEDNKIEAFKTALKESIDNQTMIIEDPKTESTITMTPNTASIISEYVNKSLNSVASIQKDGEIMENPTKLPDLSESHSNSINDGLDREDFFKSSQLVNIPETTTQPIEIIETSLLPFNKEDALLLEANKMEYARSMSRESEDELKEQEQATTIQSNNDNEIELQYTTFKTILPSIKDKDTEVLEKAHIDENTKNKEHKEETFEEYNNVTFKNKMEESSNNSLKLNEKKAKFINDNSTNVQHLNLPNNAESWNLASMKPLIKGNVTMDTAHKQNISNEIKEDTRKNTTYSINSISEKNLLDWSKVMNAKEFFTTIRNQIEPQLGKEEESYGNEENLSTTTEWEKPHVVPDITTQSPLPAINQPSIESREDRPKINSFLEQDFTNPTTTTTPLKPNSTILSHSSDNINNEEDKQTNSMNNHILETLTSSKETENTATNSAKIELNSNNPSVIIEPNLSETNLNSNHTQQNTNDEANTTMTTGKQNLNADVNVDTNKAIERATEATAGVVDMMTTILEQNSIELTTLSTLEASKQNASQSNLAAVTQQQQQNNNNNNEISQDDLEKTLKPYQKIDFETLITTTSEIPITTYRPKNLAITFTTSTTTTTSPAFKQEVDKNGNNEFETQLTKNPTEQKQSIITAFEGGNNSKPIETHLSELEFETTTLETITTTKKITENNPTTLTTTTTSVENNTSSSIDETINEQIIKLDVTTPKSEDNESNEDVITTTIGSPVIETKFEKETKEDSLTTTTTTAATTTTLETPKTPVVVVANTETQYNESSTVATIIEEDKNKIDTQTNQGSDNTEEITEKPKENQEHEKDKEVIDNNNETTTMAIYPLDTTTMKTEDETIRINLLDDTTTTTTTTSTTSQPIITTTITQSPTTTTTESTTTTTTSLPITTTLEDIYKVIYTTTTETIPTTTLQISTESEELFSSSSSTLSNMIPPTTTVSTLSTNIIETADIGKSLPTLTTVMGGNSGNMYPKNTEVSGETDVNVIIAITVSVIGVVALILLVGFLYLMRKRQKQTSYSQRCRPVSLDEYTIDNASVGGSMRKTSALRSSKRTYGNLAFDDPSLRHNPLGVHELAKFAQEKLRIFEEFRDVPQITSRLDEVPLGCEDKNRYANVLPLPETRVILQRLNDDDKTEYINANYVTGPKDPPNYFIACQAPLDTTVEDFWRMIWEQQSRVIIQATDLIENGVEKCAEYLPPSVTLDNHSTFGDFQITLQNREVKDKYAISTILLKYVTENATRELTHYWYKWPEVGVPAEEAPIIAMLLEARSSLISYAIEQANEDKEKSSTATLKSIEEGTASANGTTTSPSKDSNSSSANGSNTEINGNISMVNMKKTARNQGPLTIHCSPGTGRTGTIIACDIAIRSLETPKRTVDIPQIVYYVRRGRASAVLTKEQYEFIYKVANMYAAKISNPTSYN